MSGGRVLFVGCGPGAADLLTVRAVRALAAADVVIWGRMLLDEATVGEHVRTDAEVVAWPPATQEDVFGVYDRARDDGLLVVRLKGGDPGLFGAMELELDAVDDRGLAWEVIPGVSAVSAVSAVLGLEAATPGAPLLLSDAADLGGGRAAGDAKAAPPAIAAYMAGREPAALADALSARGLAPETPCALAADVSRPGEIVAVCRLDELAEAVTDLAAGGMTLVLAGVAPRAKCTSHLPTVSTGE